MPIWGTLVRIRAPPMFRSLLSVGGFTLLSRIAGLVRDMVMAPILGHGVLSDAFFVAFRLPNHFRTIFAEGAYNAAFVPMYTGLRAESPAKAHHFSRVMLGWQIVVQLVLLVIALVATEFFVAVLAPGYIDKPEQMALAVNLTRITFVYLICIAVVTHLGGMLNAEKKFWAAAAAPILLNIAMAGALGIAFLFPSAGHAAAWGVVAGGVLEVLLLVGAARAARLPVTPAFPTADAGAREFLKRFGPATLGAAGVQLALFADTILASYLGAGAYTSLYYADRVNQLPMGVIAIALGTILLPEMSRSTHAGDTTQTARAFNRGTEMGLLLTMPCLAAFVVFPEAIMQGLFARGAFDVEAANAAASVLVAYSWALPAFVVLRTVTPLFHAGGDTRTPVIATMIAMFCNLAVKFGLIVGLHFGVEGLALGTAVGTWINVITLAAFAWSRGLLKVDTQLIDNGLRIICATMFAAIVAWLLAEPLADSLPALPHLRALVFAAILGVATLVAYGVSLVGFGWKR